jgi:protein O-GlcNAc transferase
MPSFAPAHTNLGSLLREQGQLDQAIAHYHQAIALDPDFAEAYLNLGNTYRDIRQPPAELFRAAKLTSSF